MTAQMQRPSVTDADPGSTDCSDDPARLYTDHDVAIARYWLAHGIDLGVPIGEDIERRKAAAADAHLAARMRKTAGEPSHAQRGQRSRRHQVDAADRARQAAEPWPEESAE